MSSEDRHHDYVLAYWNSYAVKYKTPLPEKPMNFLQKLTLAIQVGTAASQLVLKGKDAEKAVRIGGQAADTTATIDELMKRFRG